MSWVNIEIVKDTIGFLKGIDEFEIINGGYSGDIKYRFIKNNHSYLLRLNKLDQQDWHMPKLSKGEKLPLIVEYMNQAYHQGVKCSKIQDYGINQDHNYIYIITSYIEGEVAEEALKSITDNNQYEIGIHLGKDLFHLHQIKLPTPTIDWAKENMVPYEKKINLHHEVKANLKHQLDENIITCLIHYIEDNKHLLNERELSLIHNDIHTGNIIIHNGQYAGLIDFNALNYGDLYYEHKYLRVNDLILYPAFCKGILDGYFNLNVPALFWRMSYLYLALNILTYLPISDIFTEEEIQLEIDYNKKLFQMFSEFNEKIPRWYKELTFMNN